MPEDLQSTVIRILAAQALLEVADVRPDRKLDDLGIDSLGLVECIFALEEAFDISIPFNANDTDRGVFADASVATVVDVVRGQVDDARA